MTLFPYEDDVGWLVDLMIAVVDFTKFKSKSVYLLDVDFVDILLPIKKFPVTY